MQNKPTLASLLLAAALLFAACGQNQSTADSTDSNATKVSEKTNEKANENLKIIEPTIGYTPDISENAKQNLVRMKQLFDKIDSTINSYPDYETAQKHLTPRQIEIWENQDEFIKEDYLGVGAMGCSWYCGGGPDSIFVSSVLAPNKNLDYKAENIHDFSLRTAWVEGAAGFGIGESVSYRFPRSAPPVTTVEIFNGYMKSDKVWQDNARVKQLKLYVNEQPFALLNLKDSKAKQLFDVGSLQNTEKELYLRFEIVEVYKGDKYEDVAISEIEFDGTGVHCFAKGTQISTPTGDIAIEKLTVGAAVLSYNPTTKKLEKTTVLALANQKHHNLYELNFEGQTIIATDDHPFYFEGQFFSILENNKYSQQMQAQQTQALKVGQAINFMRNGKMQTLKLTAIKPHEHCQMTYTITRLAKNNLFFANGACVMTEEIAHTTAARQ
jgi:hypothetical protein